MFFELTHILLLCHIICNKSYYNFLKEDPSFLMNNPWLYMQSL